MHAKDDRVNYRPPSKPPYILNANGEVIWIIEEKRELPYVEPKSKPPPNPPKICNIARVSWTR